MTAHLFQTTAQNVTHLKASFSEGELLEEATRKRCSTRFVKLHHRTLQRVRFSSEVPVDPSSRSAAALESGPSEPRETVASGAVCGRVLREPSGRATSIAPSGRKNAISAHALGPGRELMVARARAAS